MVGRSTGLERKGSRLAVERARQVAAPAPSASDTLAGQADSTEVGAKRRDETRKSMNKIEIGANLVKIATSN